MGCRPCIGGGGANGGASCAASRRDNSGQRCPCRLPREQRHLSHCTPLPPATAPQAWVRQLGHEQRSNDLCWTALVGAVALLTLPGSQAEFLHHGAALVVLVIVFVSTSAAVVTLALFHPQLYAARRTWLLAVLRPLRTGLNLVIVPRVCC